MLQKLKKMMMNMKNNSKYPKNIMVDTCFWIAYCDPSDGKHTEAIEWSKKIFDYPVLCPFPTLYEFLDTRFSRRPEVINEFDNMIKKGLLKFVYDDKYRDNIVNGYIEGNKFFSQYSLVDLIINRMIEDVNLKIDYLFTFNQEDFKRACNKRNIEMLPQYKN
jgi:predicted nucleic acid-binding protein